MNENKKRMLWIDAMRGFSMLLVVFGHVLIPMNLSGYNSFLGSVLLTFRLPLFFFVSGFFAYRALNWWTYEKIGDILKRKIQAQIIGTITFLSVFQYYSSNGTVFCNLSHGFSEYWFTIVLLQMFVVYLMVSLTCRIIKVDIRIILLIIISIAGIIIIAFNKSETWIWNFLCWENFNKYFQFFALGIVVSRFRTTFFRILTQNWFKTFVIIGWIVCEMLWYNSGFEQKLPFLYRIVHDIFIRYFALFTILSLFYSIAGKIEHSKVGKQLQFIGKRTLDIYFIHYFFIPNISFLTNYVDDRTMLVVQILIAGIITALISIMCLLISKIIRLSPFLTQWLFGVKRFPKSSIQ